jgi:hypothetical protein
MDAGGIKRSCRARWKYGTYRRESPALPAESSQMARAAGFCWRPRSRRPTWSQNLTDRIEIRGNRTNRRNIIQPQLLSLQPGVCLGPYGILSALGAGGKGEVYRGRDTNRDRVVAIILPEPFQRVHDSPRRTRSWSPELAFARTTCSLLEGRTAIECGRPRPRAGAAGRGAAA